MKQFLPILDAVAKFLLIIDSKHPTQNLGFRGSLEFGRYMCAGPLFGGMRYWGESGSLAAQRR